VAADITGNPWTVLAADASAVPIWKGVVHIENIEFEGYNLDADSCIIKDQAGRIIWQTSGAADLSTVRSGRVGNVIGVAVTNISNGAVRIYIK
jgi:hypothetical protein